jgi:hypothetical protein
MPVEPRQYDPTRAHFGKELRSQRYIPEVGDFVTEVEFEVPHDIAFQYVQEDMDPVTYDVIGAEIVNERNSNKSRRKELRYPRQLDPGSGDPATTSFPIVAEELLNAEELREFVDHTIITSRMEVKGGVIDADILGEDGVYRVEISPGQFGYHNVRKTYRAKDGDFLVRTSYDTDPTTGNRVRVTREVVEFVPAPLAAPQLPGVSVSYKEVAEGIWIKELRELTQVDGVTPITGAGAFASYTYWSRINFTFPSYIKPFDPALDLIRTLNKQQRRTIFDIRIRTRREFTANVWAKKIVSYHAAAPTRPVVFEWRYVDWRHSGALFAVNIERVIANETLIYTSTLAHDTFFGAYFEQVVFPASPRITTDQYLGQIGIETLIDVDITQIENRVFRMVRTLVVME